MTVGATRIALKPKTVQSVLRVAVGKRLPGRQGASTQCEMSPQIKVGGKRVVELTKRVRRKMDRRQELLELPHFIGGQGLRCALEIGKGDIELFQTVPVAPPLTNTPQ